jgi:hypothetical protein
MEMKLSKLDILRSTESCLLVLENIENTEKDKDYVKLKYNHYLSYM